MTESPEGHADDDPETWNPRPVPEVTPESSAYWKRASEGELALSHCRECDLVFFYPRSHCPDCFSDQVALEPASGTGTVYSYSVPRRISGWPDEHLPLLVAYVELDEGPRLVTNIVGCSPEDVEIGAPVVAKFVQTDHEDVAVPVFELE